MPTEPSELQARTCTTELAQLQRTTLKPELAQLQERTFGSPTLSFQLPLRSFEKASLPCGGQLKTAGLQGGVLDESFFLSTQLDLDKLELDAVASWLKLLSLPPKRKVCVLKLSSNALPTDYRK